MGSCLSLDCFRDRNICLFQDPEVVKINDRQISIPLNTDVCKQSEGNSMLVIKSILRLARCAGTLFGAKCTSGCTSDTVKFEFQWGRIAFYSFSVLIWKEVSVLGTSLMACVSISPEIRFFFSATFLIIL
jgi:hypothetical protein